MAKIRIVVEPAAKNRAGWFVHLFRWDPRTQTQTNHILQPADAGNGKFTFISKADLPVGIYGLTLRVFESGKACSATVVDHPPIQYPLDAKWPLEVKVPSQASQDDHTYNFWHGGHR